MNICFNTNGKYVIGVSGGPDSMTLLSLCVKQGISVVVAHVNYKKRDSADRDEKIVKDYCKQHQLIYEVLYPNYVEGNFQGWARDVRYAFYQQLCTKYHCDGVLLAHHQDDVLETYLMQMERGSQVDYYGICESRLYFKMMVYRPLLQWSRKDIMEYVKEYEIPYGIDESNLGNDYRRNQIRHDVVEIATSEQRKQWLLEIENKNKELAKYQKHLRLFVDEMSDLEKYVQADEKIRIDGLRLFLRTHNSDGVDSNRDVYLKELDEKILSGNNFQEELNDYLVLDVSYGKMCVVDKGCEYAVVIHHIVDLEHQYFKVSSVEGPSTCGMYVCEDDFPLTIRNYRDGDCIALRFGHKKISRWFMDRKIPLWQRKVWPVVENRHHEVILVSQIGCNVTHYNVKYNLFVIK